ncbi:dTMP kinase [Verrucomicrobiales bacterium BCK34]|nr:dTMP kinase [Verrucomicrobiales bacterium BCK34]
MQRGKFITFEGSEGCGKSTQIKRFVEMLTDRGFETIQTREPGGTAVGERIRDLLQHDDAGSELADESELLLFAASRAQLVREVIAPALERGAWVIADRFLDSTTVYQGGGRGLNIESVQQINAFAVGDTMPDLTILLDLDAATGHARAVAATGDKPDRMESQPIAFFEKVRQGYLDLATSEPDRISVIDASDTIEAVAAQIREVFEFRFPDSDASK